MQNLVYQTIRGGGWEKQASRIIIAHGLLGNSTNWKTTARHLAKHNLINSKLHEIDLLDMRNHGESPHMQTHTNAAMAADIEIFTLMKQKERELNAENKDDGVVLIGHSMGGLAVMATLLSRANEKALLLPSSEELKIRCERGDYYDWKDNQNCVEEMRRVNSTMGFPIQQPLRDVIYAYKDTPVSLSTSYLHHHDQSQHVEVKGPRVKAAIIVDILPSTLLGKQTDKSNSVSATLNAMAAVDLTKVRNFSDGAAALERAGVSEKSMRDFVLTNLSLNTSTGEAKWRCNLPVLRADYEKTALSLRDWFLNAEKNKKDGYNNNNNNNNKVAPVPCSLPTLFVFGEKSPYNSLSDRRLIDCFFSNNKQIEIAGAGHFVHYEKMKEFIEAVAPFLAEHI